MAETLELFGLSINQTRILFSVDKYLIQDDIEKSKTNVKQLKKEWLREWENAVLQYLRGLDSSVNSLYGLYDIHKQIDFEVKQSSSLMWYYLIILEASIFSGYTPLDKDSKKYKKLKYQDQQETLKKFVVVEDYIQPDFIDELKQEYLYNIKKIQGKEKKTIVTVFSALAVAAATAALCAAFAGPIAVALVGGQFVGLYGAALTSASLALLGGGALAAGGAGMAGGLAVIVGGGAVLGLATGGAAGSVASKALLTSPDFIVSECSKFVTVLEKVIIGIDKDKDLAKRILIDYENSILELKRMQDSLCADKSSSKDVKKISQSISYMEKTFKICDEVLNS